MVDVESQRHRVVRADGRPQPREALQALPPSLRLAAVLAGDVPGDVVALLRDLPLLLLERPLLGEPSLRALGDERLIAAGIRRARIPLEVQDVVYRAGQEGAVVADQQHRLSDLPEIVLQPLGGFEIQVVGRLIEQQHVGRAGELPGQPEAPAFAAAQHVHRRGARPGGIEAESVQHRVDA